MSFIKKNLVSLLSLTAIVSGSLSAALLVKKIDVAVSPKENVGIVAPKNQISDFSYIISNLHDYTASLTLNDAPENTPGFTAAELQTVGIILTGWADKPTLTNKNKTVYVNPQSSYTVNGTTYNVIAFGAKAFGQEIYDDWSVITGPDYNYEFILPSSLRLMYNSACSWFGCIPGYMLPLCVNSIEYLTGRQSHYPHISVDMSACNDYNDSYDIFADGDPLRGAFNYNFAFQNIDNFIWPTDNHKWTRICDDIMEDAYINCDMNLTGLKALTEIGHWGCGRWQMPSHDLYLPDNITLLDWEAFNGSRFKDVYWTVNTNTLRWNTFHFPAEGVEDDIDSLIGEIYDYTSSKWYIPTVDLRGREPEIKAELDELAIKWDTRDEFIMGNLEIANFHTNAVEYFQEHCGDSASGNAYGHSLPHLFWELGMADCPEQTIISSWTALTD